MEKPIDSHRLPTVVRALCLTACAIALLAIVGHVMHKAGLIALQPGWQGMSLLTASCVLCLAAPLAGGRAGHLRGRLAIACWLAIFIALAVLGSHAWANADVLSPWIAASLLQVHPWLSGRVSVATAVGLLALGLAGLLSRSDEATARRMAEIAANVALVIACVALLGYAYRISDLYALYIFNTMSLQSAIAIACLALARLIAEPHTRLGVTLRSTFLGVKYLRRMLVLTALPALLGWLLSRATGTVGEANSASMALLVIATSIPMFYLLLENARTVELLERGHRSRHEVEERMTDELRRQVEEHTGKLAESHRLQVQLLAQSERDKRFSMIAQLAAGMAHDFNNLLMVIGGNTQLLKLRLRADGSVQSFLDKIAATVKGASRLTAQLSAFSDTQRLDIAPFHVDAVVRAAISETIAQRGSDIQLSARFAAGDSRVLGDAVQLQLALVHLIRNACEAMGSGGKLDVSSALHTPEGGRECVTISVVDNGCGMSEEELRRAEEPFYTTKGESHFGLGLAQASSVMHQAGGSLTLASTKGVGTRVELHMPCIFAPANPTGPVEARDPASRHRPESQRLLLIDDNDDVRSVVAALLRGLDYQVIEAGGGRDGLELLRQHTPALLIVDYLMPEMNGAEVAFQARKHLPDLPIIFISGFADSKAIDAVPRSTILRKPVDADDLARAVVQALDPVSGKGAACRESA